MLVAIIKYNAGNIKSVAYALERLGVNSVVTDDEEIISKADKVIFPGVGHAQPAMKYLQQNSIDRLIQQLTQPVLGICLGMQLMCNYTEEGYTEGMGIFDTIIKKFDNKNVKVPSVGWNIVKIHNDILFSGINDEAYFYFVHSYYALLSNDTIAQSNYEINFSSVLKKNNYYGTQFHPEKSGKTGEVLLKNFLEL